MDALPNGPRNHPTVEVFLAGGVPEVMLHLRARGVVAIPKRSLSRAKPWIIRSIGGSNRNGARSCVQSLKTLDGIDADDVILAPANARERGLTSTVCFPSGNLAPEGSVVKATAIDPSVVDADGVYRKRGPAKVFLAEKDAIAAIKANKIKEGDVLVLDLPRTAWVRAWRRPTRSPRALNFCRLESMWP